MLFRHHVTATLSPPKEEAEAAPVCLILAMGGAKAAGSSISLLVSKGGYSCEANSSRQYMATMAVSVPWPSFEAAVVFTTYTQAKLVQSGYLQTYAWDIPLLLPTIYILEDCRTNRTNRTSQTNRLNRTNRASHGLTSDISLRGIDRSNALTAEWDVWSICRSSVNQPRVLKKGVFLRGRCGICSCLHSAGFGSQSKNTCPDKSSPSR